MVSVFCSQDTKRITDVESDFGVLLFGSVKESPYGFSIGNSIRNEILHLNLRPTQRCFDFLAIALSVVAADSFILRSEHGADGFARDIQLTVAIGHPAAWIPAKAQLERALCFLTGDRWCLELIEGGERTVSKIDQAHIQKFNQIHKSDSVCLFSGGMDSFMGVVRAIHAGQNPTLVSRASTGDQSYQDNMARAFPDLSRFVVNDSPWSPHQNELSSRSRSVLFIALAGVVCSCLSSIKQGRISLQIPENGFIALNPPLTKRRIGANSTRTAHPHYLSLLQSVFDQVGLPINLENPFMLMTKGEMLVATKNHKPEIDAIEGTVSCGHWKRSHIQCGRCWPCLIRRSSFHRAEISDYTPYETEEFDGILADTIKGVDIRAALYAIHQIDRAGKRSSPLRSIREISNDATRYQDYLQLAARGFEELREFLFEMEVWQ